MKLLCALAPLAVLAKYQARVGEFCGKADNGEFHDCHHGLTCQGAKCVAGTVAGHLRGGPEAPSAAASHVVHHVVHYVDAGHQGSYYDAPHYGGSYHVVHHDTYQPHYVTHYSEPHYYSGAHHVIYHDQPQHYTTHHYAPYHYASAPATYPAAHATYPAAHATYPAYSPVTSNAGWTSVKPEDYTAEGQACSGITGLGAAQKPCAPWLACYKQTSSGWFFGRAYGGHYGAATTGICKPKVVHVGQACGHGTSKFGYINVGRCGWYAHCQSYAALPGQSLGQGICTQWPIERAEDFVDPFHQASQP